MKNGSMISFDFFDTLFTRRVARPVGIFALVGHELEAYEDNGFSHDFIIGFKEIRCSAESIARLNTHYEDINLDEIYSVIKESHSLNDEQVTLIRQIELNVERGNLIPVGKYLKRMKEEIDRGTEVYVLSDMYLPSLFLKEILSSYDQTFSDIPIFVSGETRKTKRAGTLFGEAKSLLSRETKYSLHIGDNYHADFLVPKRLGVNAELVLDTILENHESQFADNLDLAFADLIVGQWRAKRLSGLHPKEYLGFKYVTSVFFGFVYETLLNLSARKTKKVYFLARDGQVLKQIADMIVEKLNLEIQTDYVYISRRSIMLSSLFELNDDFWDKVFLNTAGISYNRILSRMHISIDEFEMCGGKISPKSNTELTKSELEILKNQFKRMRTLKELILKKAKESRELAYSYFDSIGFCDQEIVHIVDVGWKGTLQDGIYKLYRNKNKDFKIEGWYWGVFKNSRYSNAKNVKNSYIFYSEKLKPYSNIESYIELLAQADHGQTISYGSNGPILDSTNHLLIEKWELAKVHKGVEEGTAFFISLLEKELPFYDMKKLALSIVDEFKAPSQLFANLLGTIPYSVEQDDSNSNEVAPKISYIQFFKSFISPQKKTDSITRWMEGSVVRSFHPAPAHILLSIGRGRFVLVELREIIITLLRKRIRSLLVRFRK